MSLKVYLPPIIFPKLFCIDYNPYEQIFAKNRKKKRNVAILPQKREKKQLKTIKNN